MSVRQRSRCLLLPVAILVLAIFSQQASRIQAWTTRTRTTRFLSPSSLSFSSDDSFTDGVAVVDVDFKPSFYATNEIHRRSGKPIWKQRKQLSELRVGEQLEGVVIVQEHLDGVTGPKIFLECGVGTYNPKKQTWKMANAMLRLGRRGTKGSVTKKRLARLRKKTTSVSGGGIECYVSRIRLDSGQLEVVLNPGDVPSSSDSTSGKVPVSALKPGQEVAGEVRRLVPYGAFVDVGTNRNGLLHIQKVADLYGSYIDKEKGLKEAGLERGAKVKLQIVSNEKKQIFLDFTEQVKEEAEKERIERQKSKEEKQKQTKQEIIEEKDDSTTAAAAVASAGGGAGAVVALSDGGSSPVASSTTTEVDISQEEADAWAAYADMYDEDEDEDYDDYDEDRDIEDALGLGTY